MSICTLCPRECKTERPQSHANAKGFCKEGSTMRISRAALHFWEEPCISGKSGSGAVFFTGCNLQCIFCQNAAISEDGIGREVTPDELCQIFFDLKEQGAHNINLVTPSHFVPEIRRSILLAKEKGFDLPFVYNSSAYEKPETLRLLDGLIDIYLPDFKYMDGKMAADYSHASDYPEVAKAAIAEMIRQVGTPLFDEESGLMIKGVIVRHLLLPLGVNNACSVIEYLHQTYGDRIYLSVMNQYTPLFNVPGALSDKQKKRLADFPVLHRKVTKREYDKVIRFCLDRDMSQVFIQEGDVASESFIPPFPSTSSC